LCLEVHFTLHKLGSSFSALKFSSSSLILLSS
jgi:hypothetical protein